VLNLINNLYLILIKVSSYAKRNFLCQKRLLMPKETQKRTEIKKMVYTIILLKRLKDCYIQFFYQRNKKIAIYNFFRNKIKKLVYTIYTIISLKKLKN